MEEGTRVSKKRSEVVSSAHRELQALGAVEVSPSMASCGQNQVIKTNMTEQSNPGCDLQRAISDY